VVTESDCRGLAAINGETRQQIIDAIARRNVVRVVRKLLEESPAIRQLVADRRIGVVGMMYDVVSGEVDLLAETRHGV
jgi:carbonic anhydrase